MQSAYQFTVPGLQGREGKVVQVYRKKWVIHVERITREKVNGMPGAQSSTSSSSQSERVVIIVVCLPEPKRMVKRLGFALLDQFLSHAALTRLSVVMAAAV